MSVTVGVARIQDLPPELLATIFLQCMVSVPASHTTGTSALLRLSHICGHLRAVALATPALWTTIDVRAQLKGRGAARIVDLWATRAGSLGLKISLAADQAGGEHILRAAVAYHERWQDVDLFLQLPNSTAIHALDGAALPLLRRLSMRNTPDGLYSLEAPIDLSGASSLEELCVVGLPPNSFTGLTSRLRVLRMGDITDSDSESDAYRPLVPIDQFMRSFQDLFELTLDGFQVTTRILKLPPIHFPRLERLSVHGIRCTRILSLPRLRHLRLQRHAAFDQTGAFWRKELRDLGLRIVGWGCDIRSLHLVVVPPTVSGNELLAALVPVLPEVETLRLEYRRGAERGMDVQRDTIAEAIALLRVDPTLASGVAVVPQLQTLQVVWPEKHSLSAGEDISESMPGLFIELLRSRKRPQGMLRSFCLELPRVKLGMAAGSLSSNMGRTAQALAQLLMLADPDEGFEVGIKLGNG